MSELIDSAATMSASTLLVVVTFYDDVLSPEDALARAHEHVSDAWDQIQAVARERLTDE